MKYLASLPILFGLSAAHTIVKRIVIDGNVYASERLQMQLQFTDLV
jgi:hypothetical protein